MRARNSTDAVIPSRAGYPTATLCSMDRYKALSNYHQMTDTPENVNYRTVRRRWSSPRPWRGNSRATPGRSLRGGLGGGGRAAVR